MTVLKEFWRGVCEFGHAPDDGRTPEGINSADATAMYKALELERDQKVNEALAIYDSICTRHPLAAARISELREGKNAARGWAIYKGKVNGAVIALQCFALAKKIIGAL